MKEILIIIGIGAALVVLIAIIRKSTTKDYNFIKEALKPYHKELVEFFAGHGMNQHDLYPESQIYGVTREFILESRMEIDTATKDKLLSKLHWMQQNAKINESRRTSRLFW